MRILITGASGFLGRHVTEALNRLGQDVELIALSRQRNLDLAGVTATLRADVSNAEEVALSLKGTRVDACVHVAGAMPPASSSTLHQGNVAGTANLIEALEANRQPCRFVLLSSCAVYGHAGSAGDVDEATPLAPLTAYGESCVAREMVARLLAPGRGLELVTVRLFNLVGPGQPDTMMVPAVARQIARIEKSLQPPTLSVGRLDTLRDYVDVRDAATAVASITLAARPAAPILNLGSGVVSSGAEVLDVLVGLSEVPLAIDARQDARRSTDIPRIRNRSELARTRLPWTPRYTLRDSLTETLADWRTRTRAE